MASLEHWDAGSIASSNQWVKDPVLLQLRHRLQLQLGCDPWPGNSHTPQSSQKKKKKKITSLSIYLYSMCVYIFQSYSVTNIVQNIEDCSL